MGVNVEEGLSDVLKVDPGRIGVDKDSYGYASNL